MSLASSSFTSFLEWLHKKNLKVIYSLCVSIIALWFKLTKIKENKQIEKMHLKRKQTNPVISMFQDCGEDEFPFTRDSSRINKPMKL